VRYAARILIPFDVAFHHASAHGVMTAIHIPDSPDPVPESVLSTLPPAEAAFARTLRAYKQVSFVGGRIALRTAATQLGHQVGPILPDDGGGPTLPAGLALEERTAISELPENRRWIALLVRFSIKESIYKALYPYVRRYVGFHEALVEPDVQGSAKVELRLAKGEGPFRVEARYEWLHGKLLTSARIKPAT
jgi:enterobactin synthetase component D